MTESELRTLFATLTKFKNISNTWSGVLVYWINRADGYLEMMTLDEEQSTSAFLLEKLIEILNNLNEDTTDFQLIKVLSKNFEILYFRAQFGHQYWNSTKESFREFCENHHMQLPNQIIIENPHERAFAVEDWLRSLLY